MPRDALKLAVSAQPAPPIAAPAAWRLNEEIQTRTLDNGLEVLAICRPASPVVSTRLYVAAGSRFDGEHPGRAHLTEHCLASGAHLEGRPVELTVQCCGAELDAGTHREYLHFGVTAMSGDLPLALSALGEICIRSDVDTELVHRQQAIIRHEMMEYHDGINVLWDQLFTALWESHPFVAPVVGDESVFDLGPTDIQRHLDRVMRPDRAVLAVVGDVQMDQLVSEAERVLGSWQVPRHITPPAMSAPVPRERPAWCHIEAQLQHSYFLVGWPVPSAGSPHDPAMAMLSRILGEGAGAVLSRRLREQDLELYTVQAMVLQFGDTGTLAVSGSCAPERLETVINKITEQLSDVDGAAGVTEEDLQRAQASYEGCLARRYETAHRRAGLLALNGLWGTRWTLQDRIDAVSRLTLDDLRGAVDEVLAGTTPALAVIGS